MHTLSSVQEVRDRLFIRLLILNSLRTGTIVFETRQWLQDGLCRHQCAKRYSGFPPTSLRWSATTFWPMMIWI